MKIKGILLALLLLASCADKRSKRDFGYSESTPPFDAVAVNSNDVNQNAIPLDRKLIKDGSLSFETGDIKKTQSEIAEIFKSLKGYASNETLSKRLLP